MTNEIAKIKIGNCEIELRREFITSAKNVANAVAQIKDLKNQVFDFSTKEGIKDAKALKTKANKWVKELAAFCEPLEAEGKAIQKTRSLLSTTLSTGKEAVIDAILAPVIEREDKLKNLKDSLFIPSFDIDSNNVKLEWLTTHEKYEWLAFKDEALELIERQKQFLVNERVRFIEDAKIKLAAEVKVQEERDESIRVAATTKAKEEAQKAIDEANKKVEEANKQIKDVKRTFLTPKPVVKDDVARQAEVHNEILQDLSEYHSGNIDEAKAIIKAIVNGKIRNLTITY